MDFSFFKHQLHSSLNFTKIENTFERKQGSTGMIYGEWIHTYTEDAPSFMKLLLECSWHKLVGERGNLSSRAQFGLSTNNFSPFAPFVLDGLINVRGIGNRVERGTASLVLNTEYRHTFWKHDYVTVQAAGFVDYGTLRTPGDDFEDFLTRDEQNIFTGIGIRAHLNVFYKISLRIDYSINPTDITQRGFTFGFGQFF
jgi:outer membrane protein insertion porin family